MLGGQPATTSSNHQQMKTFLAGGKPCSTVPDS